MMAVNSMIPSGSFSEVRHRCCKRKTSGSPERRDAVPKSKKVELVLYPATQEGTLSKMREAIAYKFRDLYYTLKGGPLAKIKRTLGINLQQGLTLRGVDVHLEPRVKRVKEPLIPKALVGYPVREAQYLEVFINGVSAELCVDSGTSKIVLSSRRAIAMKYNLLVLEWRTITVCTLTDKQQFKEAVISNQTITLPDGKEIVSDISVYHPECLSIIGAKLLKENHCLQKFRKDGSCHLYVRRNEPDCQCNQSVVHGFSLKGFFKRSLRGEPLKIKIDTGTPYTILSEVFMRKLTGKYHFKEDSIGNPSALKLVSYPSGFMVETSQILVMKNPGDDICIGRDLLINYEALIDYGENYIYFYSKGSTYSIKIFDGYSNFLQNE